MKYAILADIHSNLTALQAVLADIEVRGVEEIWCLGDIIGYGPDPHECLETMRRRNAVCIAGNHDLAAIGAISTTEFNPVAAEASRWTAQQLNEDERRFISRLPHKLEKGPFTLAHGSPREPIWEYLLSAEEAEQNLNFFQTKYCLVGHSHVPLVFECDAKGRCITHVPAWGKPLRLPEKRLIINPGGVGQPRNHDPRASYGLYDGQVETITLHRVEYDIPAVQRRMGKARLPSSLAERLAYGM